MLRKAHAKINLGLRILRRRDDGYHEIETVFTRVALADELVFSPSTRLAFEQNAPDLRADETNLVLRAARLLTERCTPFRGAHIALRKRIPVGAGLGGGSADAASTLLGLNDLWQLNLSRENLHQLGAQLGSDVPYFLRPGTAYATGRGESLRYFHCPLPYWIVTLFSGDPVSTAWAYRQVPSGTSRTPAGLDRQILHNLDDPARLDTILANDFEPLVFPHHPSIPRDVQLLRDRGALVAHMSGSGSSVYGLFADATKAQDAASVAGRDSVVSITPPNFEPGA